MIFNSCIPQSQWANIAPAPRNRFWARVCEQVEDGIYTAWEEQLDHRPTAAEMTELAAKALMQEKMGAKALVSLYADSPDVKKVNICGTAVWWNDSKRSTIRAMVNARKDNNETTVTLWIDEQQHIVTIEEAISVLDQMDIASSDIFNAASSKKAEIDALTDIYQVHNYDAAAGFPEPRTITL